jgi:hypothetical protein
MQKNWKRLNYFSPTPIEAKNQTAQAPYCAAYLSVLATKYGSFIPALPSTMPAAPMSGGH